MTKAPYDSDIAPVAAMFADRTRARMLMALLDGRPLAAGELARSAGVTAPTASAHLARLQEARFVTVIKQGRHRYYRLAGPEIAQVIEALSQVGQPVEPRSLRQSRQAIALQEARTCYDHLAGRAGVALYEALVARGTIVLRGGSHDVTSEGEELLGAIGVEIPVVRRSRRKFAGECLDWTERRPHLNGALAAAITERLIDQAWFERTSTRRALRLTPAGREGLAETFGMRLS